MFSLNDVKSIVNKSLGRPALVVMKYSPEILVYAGVVGVVASTVLACRATLKVNEVMAQYQPDLNNIHKVSETVSKETYSDEDKARDLTLVYIKRTVDLVKLYAPALALGVVSIGAILGSHHILNKRNMALVAAYKVIEESYLSYRRRVAAELGEEKDHEFRYGMHKEVVTETTTDAEGKEVKTEQTITKYDPVMPSDYARFFDEVSVQWRKQPEYNQVFLRAQQNYANDLLKSRGHVFLNEVYDMLGIPRSQAGTIVGWVKDSEKGDNFIDFGIYNANNAPGRDFVNGYNRSILLDFNVDGVIWDMI